MASREQSRQKKKKGARDPKRGRPYPPTKNSAQEVLHFVWQPDEQHLQSLVLHFVQQFLSLLQQQHVVAAQEDLDLQNAAQPLKRVALMAKAKKSDFMVTIWTG